MNNAPNNNTVYIYALCEPDPPHNVRYVGQTRNDPTWRYYMHLSGHKTRGKSDWLASLRATGRHAVIRVLDIVLPEQADAREQFHIADQVEHGAALLNIVHNPTAPPQEHKRDAVYTERLMVKLKPRDKDLLERIADERGIPSSIVAREVIMDYIAHHPTQERTPTPDDDSPA